MKNVSKKLRAAGITAAAATAKIAVYLSLPFKFLQFFRQSWKEQKNKTNRDK